MLAIAAATALSPFVMFSGKTFRSYSGLSVSFSPLHHSLHGSSSYVGPSPKLQRRKWLNSVALITSVAGLVSNHSCVQRHRVFGNTGKNRGFWLGKDFPGECPKDWTYAEAELKRQLGSNFLIHVSSSNTYIKTFAGIDGAGRRLADEVLTVVQKTKSLRKISFLAHSLGGLFTRYAVAVLYSSDKLNKSQHNNIVELTDGNPDRFDHISPLGKIAGLEPINFITLATPHLGVRGRKQLPFLLGVSFLEKLAAPLAPMFTGRTGSQLFLTDGEPKNPPLLLRMTSDFEDLKFLSSLAAFKNRILYANVSYDHMVGWRTSSIRRETELVKPPLQSLDGYKHIVNVKYCPPILSDGPHFPLEAAKAKEAAKNVPTTQNTAEYHDVMEEEMIRGLQRIGWKKVDVSFHSTCWPFFAHNNIHVKSEWLHHAGAGVIAHVAESLKQQESRSLIGASL